MLGKTLVLLWYLMGSRETRMFEICETIEGVLMKGPMQKE
jgi:hypothetical protein